MLSFLKVNIQILVLLFAFTLAASAQRAIKWKDVMETLEKGSKEESYMALLAFQQQNPDNALVYYKLARITEYYANFFDPMIDPMLVAYFTYETKNYLGLSKAKLDEKEVKKNREYLTEIKIIGQNTKLEYPDVLQDIETRIKANQEYKYNVDIITRNFNSSVKHYNTCLRLFQELNVKNVKIKDLYMTAIQTDIDVVLALKSSYDSTLYYLEELKTALHNYPIRSYAPSYTIKPIITHRLEGLTPSNFLTSNFIIWDFGTWTKDFFKILNGDVKDLRVRILETDKYLDETIKDFSSRVFYTDSLQYYMPEKALLFKISKYDYNSPVVSLFEYKQKKVKLLATGHSQMNNPNFNASWLDKARYYNNTSAEIEDLSNELALLQNNINDENILKYPDFLLIKYSGKNGLQNFVQNEAKEHTLFRDKLQTNLLRYIINQKNNPDFAGRIAVLNADTAPYFKSGFSTVTAAYPSVQTHDYKFDNKGNLYLAGSILESANKSTSFIAMVKASQMVWMKKINSLENYFNSALTLSATDSGCFVVTHERSATDSTKRGNSLHYFNQNGLSVKSIKLESTLIPRMLIYNDLDEQLLIAFKGNEYVPNNTQMEDMFLYLTDMNGKNLWTSPLKFSFTGSVADVVRLEQNFILFANTSEYKAINGSVFQNQDSRLFAFTMVPFTPDGFIQEIIPSKIKGLHTLQKVVKLSNEKLNLYITNTPPTEYNTRLLIDSRFTPVIITPKGEIIAK